MDKSAYKQFTNTATEMTRTIVQGQAELFDMFAKNAKGTPMAPFFDAASRMQRATLEGFEALNATVQKGSSKKKLKKAAKDAAGPIKASEKALKSMVDAQANAMVAADTAVIQSQAEAAEAMTAPVKSAEKVEKEMKDAVGKDDDAASADEPASDDNDLTAVTGIGPSTMKKLQAEGVKTVSDLAKMSASKLDTVLEKAGVRMTRYSSDDWIGDAKKLTK